MSYDKNTIFTSKLDSIKEILEELEEECILTEIGTVGGYGANDICGGGMDAYPIRKLEYRNKVVLERMERSHDCDDDDYLVSYTFIKGLEPKDWPVEVYIDCEGDCNCEREKDAEFTENS